MLLRMQTPPSVGSFNGKSSGLLILGHAKICVKNFSISFLEKTFNKK